jgi:nucleoside-diphosphate-sugar epimerase
MLQKILVTGASGLIGRNAYKSLISKQYHVVLNDVVPSLPDVINKVLFLEGDLLKKSFTNLIETMDFNSIVHCAALLPDAYYGERSTKIAKVNRLIDDAVINLCIKNHIKLIYISSASIYGVDNNDICFEEKSIFPRGPYLHEKAFSESKIINNLPENSIILRINAPYGVGQQQNTVLHTFINRALTNQDLLIFGSGLREQDFTSAVDIGEAIERAVNKPNISGIFNIASGKPISMINLAKTIIRNIPQSTSQIISSGKPDPQENYRARFDVSKAKILLGWTPRISLASGIKLLINHAGDML